MRGARTTTTRARVAVAFAAMLLFSGASAGSAHAGLIGTLTGPVTGLLDVVTAGWDDGVTTAPVSMATVADAIGADDLWARGVDGAGVGVAIIDSGVVPVDGLAGAGKVVNGPDLSFESQATDYRYLDTFGHGTHMAGIIAGNDDGSFRGVAPGARLINLKVATRDGATDVSQVIAAIDWVVQHRHDPGLDIRVLNLSYGTDGTQSYRVDPLAKAVEEAARHGIVVVVSGGNDGSDRPSLVNPATDPYVLAVGAVNLKGTASALDDVVAPFSSRGSSTRSVDVVAPGVSITSLRNPGSTIDSEHASAVVADRFFRGSGTSQAAAVVSGAAALLLDARPDLTPDQVKRLLMTTASPLLLTGTRAQGAGRINVNLASLAPKPLFATQTWAPATGLGSLEAARGTSHVADDGVELTGERDVMSSRWDGAVWAPRAEAGAAWTGGTWNGADWTGDCFCALSWAGSSWEGRRWTGDTWTGRRWTGDDWAGRRWTGRRWTGDEWTGRRWTGDSWTGRSWTAPA
jgi:serine protease AprX